ncbi:hypothetical protein HN51_042602 [Arachis hypogaea]|uniref:Serine carboxypeptidase-like n=1 Tax=Arachis hypogaea TaxID=3818 RepID=A0A444Y8Z3_ARAHY|nr:serine carboxypeptidase-like 50 [Arachis ipaensis]XP_025672759.1 serine carboxypeptidase-like 50 [Arachis hypogaea]QHN94719.1 Serine carboxypeptidase-like [Arachis hypogaea]RYQ98414.1 hypothetical protein Ahy_B08g094454 [Arachis hypogaea]
MNTLFFFISFCLCIQTHASASSNSSKSNTLFPKEAHPTKSGYLSVSKTSSSAFFYTFYEAQNSTLPLSKTPLLIWLQGGPGSSSMIGSLYAVGPWRITESITLEPNPGAWNKFFGVLFLDNPIGTGFSIASSPQEIPTNQEGIAKHLYVALTRFLQLDPVYKHRPIYIVGQSYGGKYASTTGNYILKRNAQLHASKRVNLVGVAIGNGIIEAVTQSRTHPANAYYEGLINERQKSELEKDQLEVVRLAQIQHWSEATIAWRRLQGKLQNMSGLATLYDYTRKDHPYHYQDWVTQFLNIAEVKKALGVNEPQVFKSSSSNVGEALLGDIMKSVKFMVEGLLKSNTIRVLLYQGQLDLVAGPVQTAAWVNTMKWEGIEEYVNAERKIWRVNGELAGYVQQWKSLTNVVVLGGGHLMPADQPVNAQTMIQDWVLQRGLYQNV